jgi:alkylated DNA repair dioxygenase AlkB
MIDDLFASADEMQPLPMDGADISCLRRMQLPLDEVEVMARLVSEVPWRSEKITVWGKTHVQPRLIAWYGDEGCSYSYSGMRMEALPWSPLLSQIRQTVEHHAGVTFNSVLLNYYRDNRDSMGFHSDDEPELGRLPTIASLSLGAPRTLIFKPRGDLRADDVKLLLESGSLLLMRGDTQKNWKHGIAKQTRPCGGRVNLTFRRIGLDV